jgi:hypothetical protein
MLFSFGFVLALAGCAFYGSLAGRRQFREELAAR